ncbi:hypothetical protein IT400_04490 [Candidatus Nomurabacteria bacterium]|nr:hypothetical protein [Candidatus Nomurabacteria bacterium]
MKALVIIASICFILNKFFLLLPFGTKWVSTKFKWFLGMLGAILFIIYFFSIGSPMLSTLEIGLTILTLYRFIVEEKRSQIIEYTLGIFTGIIVFILYLNMKNGFIQDTELLGSWGMIIGTFFLIQDKLKMGFILYGIGHLFLVYFGYSKNETVFWNLQLVQAFMCFSILIKEEENRYNAISIIVCLYMLYIGYDLFV